MSTSLLEPENQPAEDQVASSEWLLLTLAIPLGIIVGIYWPTLVELILIWENDENYSHGFVVPIAAIWFGMLAWEKSGPPVSDQVSKRDMIIGATTVCLALAMHFFIWISKFDYIWDVFCLIFIILGTLRFFGGSKVSQAYSFAVIFLIFMAPWPERIYGPMARSMQEIASVVSYNGLEILGIPVLRDGYIIRLPDDFKMEVAEACSGLRQLTAILALSVAIGHLSERSILYRVVLVGLAIPIAIAGNCIRVLVTGLILVYGNREWAEGVFHSLEGLATVAVSAAIVVLCAWLLGNFFDEFGSKKSTEDGSTKKKSEPAVSEAT